jgi:eukaryotic-like serine/threonine-protein kinase
MSEPATPQIEFRRRIQLTRLIGEGGMGRVLDGYAPDLGQYVAVKILRAEHANDSEVRGRFEEEIALLGHMDHPGCPPVYGQGEDADGMPCYAMKKVEGRTLADLLAERGPTTRSGPWRRRLLAILLDACETMAYAHELGVVHRDLKPENILIDRHRSVYVIDWGIAKRMGASSGTESQTLPGKVMGSPGYMAPEQAEGRAASAGPQADVFALGAVLYEILTGRRPFGGAGGREEVLATVHRDPKPPHRGNWRLPRSISRICMKALHKDPARRYADARGLASDLRAFLEGRLSLLERLRDAARIHPFRAIAVGVMALVLLIGIGNVAAQFWTDQRLANRALARVAEMDAELAKIAGEAESVRAEIEDAKSDSGKRSALNKRLHVLDARWILTEFEAVRLLASVAEMRFIWVESEIQPLARKRLIELGESLNARDQPALASGLAKNVLARHAEGDDPFKLSEADVAKLKQFAAEADRRFVAPRD